MTYHTNKEPGLLSGTPDTCITDNTDSETGGETSKTDRETGTKLDETSVQWHRGCDYLSAGEQKSQLETHDHQRSGRKRRDRTVLSAIQH